jgi:peptide/nickel transport system permease protein
MATAIRASATTEPRRGAGLSYWQRARRHLQTDRISISAGLLLAVVALVSLGAPVIGRVLNLDPAAQELLLRLEGPSARHWLGTDELGRDILIRVLYAGQVSLLIGVLATVTALTIGVTLGMLAGFYRGWVDDGINALVQTTANIPLLFLLILLSVVFSPGVPGLAIILGLLSWQGTARQVRGVVLSVSQRDYIDAARVLGSSNVRLMVRHVLPNVLSIVLVVAGFDVAGAILAESGLSALGLGVQPPTASWGNMLAKSFQYALKAPWLVAAPGVMIFLTVFSVFLSADGVRDALDPRLS